MNITRRRMIELMGAGGVSAFALGLFLSDGGDFAAVTPANAQDLSTLLEPGPMGDKVLGDEDAPVTIVEYASMTCGHCRDFHKDNLPVIQEKYIDTGKVRMIFREFPFDPRSAAAFMLARCAPEDKYFPMVDVLFQQQAIWARAEDPVAELEKISRLAGFTQEEFTACLKNQEVLDSVLSVQKKAAKDYGVESTPTFFINGVKYEGNLSHERMSEIIDGLL